MSARIHCIAAVLLMGAIWLPDTTIALSQLPPLGKATEAGWQAYVTATEGRLARESTRDLPDVPAGTTSISRVDAQVGQDGRAIDVPDAWVHHWRGAILVPGVTLDQLLARLERNVPTAPDVISSTVLRRDGPQLTVFLRVQREQTLAGILTVTFVYDTVHAVTLARVSGTRGSSTIRATRISEIEGAGSGRERILPAAEDHGFLWRWNSYWRYQQTAAGVIAQCESVSLSRTAPFVVRAIADRVAASAATDSMTRALVSLRDWMASDRMPRVSSQVQSALR